MLVSAASLIEYFFEIIDPFSINKQGDDVGEKYRTGIYSENQHHLDEANIYIDNRTDHKLIVVEVKPLENYVRSAAEHQDRLDKFPEDYCHIPKKQLTKYI